MTALAELTTLRLGGPAGRLVEADTDEAILAAVQAADAAREPLLILAGGSNLVVADAGFPGTVLHIATRSAPAAPGSSASPGSPAPSARRRSRTSAPTARR